MKEHFFFGEISFERKKVERIKKNLPNVHNIIVMWSSRDGILNPVAQSRSHESQSSKFLSFTCTII